MPAMRTRLLLRALERRLAPAVFTVSNLFDAGAGSLRDAITQLNLSSDPANTIDATGVSGTVTLATALPAIAKPVDILGPGAAKLAVSGNNAVRVFNVNNGGGPLAVSITGLTITAGKATGSDGGGIFLGDDVLTLREVTISNCTSTTQGGGIGVASEGTLLMDGCTISGNTALVGGGVYFQYNGRFVIENSTISGNSATGAEAVGGGGLYFFGIAKNGASAIRNSTISGNSAVAGNNNGGGGVCLYFFSGTLDIENSTIVNNSVTGTDAAGGGLSVGWFFTTFGFLNIRSSIIAGNASPSAYPDLFADSAHTVVSSNSAYTADPATSGVYNFAGTGDLYGAALNLGPLANNGGLVQTHALLSGSAAIDKGFNAGPSGTDGRGPTYARKVGAAVDIGAFEFGSAPGTPTGSLSNLRLTKAGGTSQSFTVLWADDGSVDVALLGNDDLRVTGPGGYDKLATLTGTKTLSPGRVQATYSVPAGAAGNPAKWDGFDNGVYIIAVEAGKVLDTLGSAVTADAVAELEVAIALPTAAAKAADVKTAQLGTATNAITVTYMHEVPIAAGTVGVGDVRVTCPGGFDALAAFKSQSPGSDSTTVTAVYEVTAPGGTWDTTDLGPYQILLEAGQVTDTDGVAVPAGPIGSFTVALPTVLTVNAANDETADTDGKTSLREALAFANANVSDNPDTVTFDPAVFASASTITLDLGELPITDGVTVVGPGAGQLTLKAGPASRHINVNEPNGVSAITLSGLRLTDGDATDRGGAIRLQSTDEMLTLADMVFENNRAKGFGGAVASEPGNGVLTNLLIDRCIFRGNTADGWGGAIQLNANSAFGAVTHGNQLKVTNSTFEGNTAASGHDGALSVHMSGATLAGSAFIEGCLFTNNAAIGGDGGAVGFRSSSSGNVSILNSTFTGNKALDPAVGRGGAIRTGSAYSGTVTVRNSTIAFNQAYNGGGAYSRTSGAATLNLESCIIYNNSTATTGNTDFNGGTVSAKDCIVFSTTGVSTFSSLGGNQFGAAADPFLQPLSDNGGISKTHRPGPSSAARDAGSNPAGLAFDQRGPGFPRVLDGKADVGAMESIDEVPAAKLTPGDVFAPGATFHTFTVLYTDDVAVSVATLGTGDVNVIGPGVSLTPTFLGVDIPGDGTPRVATYGFTPPGGSWDPADDGVYTVSALASQVSDGVGNFVKAGPIGTFTVGIPLNLVVNATNDEAADTDGKLSLREAVLAAEKTTPSNDVITFDPAVFAGGKIVTLTLGELVTTDSLTVQGLGAGQVVISGGGASRMFRAAGPAGTSLSLSNLSLSSGKVTGNGGAVHSANAAVVLTDVVASGNSATGTGGAVFLEQSSASLTATSCRFVTNVAGSRGGAVANLGNSTIHLLRCEASGNQSVRGGAFSFETGLVTVEGCLLTGNTATVGGGAVSADNFVTKLQFVNSTVSGNTAGTAGGGIELTCAGGTLELVNCTLIGNSASQGGAVYDNTLTNPPFFISLVSSIVVANPGSEDIFTAIPIDYTKSAFGTITAGGKQTDNGGNLPGSTVTSLKLGPLADNGGPTLTHALLPGSPAVNAGSNTLGLTTDQRGPGFVRVFGGAADMGAYELQTARVVAVAINAGAAQRSRVTTLTVTFDQPVTLPVNPADAFQLKRQSDNALVALSATVAGNAVTLTFIGGPVEFGSLGDGRYTLTVIAAQVNGGVFDGNGDGSAGDDYLLVGTPGNGLFRLFGDADGDGDVDVVDWGAFRGAFGATSPAFDFEDDGDVDALDYGQFRGRFGAGV